ncbi:MAG: tRNA lysidine(34) synthetase TilS [Bacteroidetes bacterium]|nr:tRNA lysidine(34) synthetase TilS [Bacteroidota bacterium]
MLEQLLSFLQKEKLIPSLTGRDREGLCFLLTVSGGVDSVVMCDLFHKAGFSFGIAHCNFKLRGKESDEDEQFVKLLAEKYNVPFHKKKFNTKSYADKKKISIQMAARDLRYEWLKRLAKEKKYDFIATAHHLDDSIETFFINILRGTGIAGLQGVPVKHGNIIRPLLFAGKKMIRDYAEENNLKWREDSSNFTDKYLRNNIRHHLIPSLKKLNAGFEKTITKELSYFKEAGEIFKKFVEEKKKEIVVEEGKNILLNIKKLKDSGHAETLLHELLRAYDFTPETTELIAQRMYTTAGKKFLSPTYRLIKDRDFLILTPKHANKENKEFLLKENQNEFQNENLKLKIEIINGNLSKIKDKSSSVAHLDYSALAFPLIIRKWKRGDFFFPLGMNGKKKLSDFFVDQKIPIPEKEYVYVLESNGKIVWVINYRIDNRFKVLPGTKKILKVASVV